MAPGGHQSPERSTHRSSDESGGVSERARGFSVLAIASFALGTLSVLVIVIQLVVRESLGVSSLSDAVSSDLEHALLEASTFAAITAAGLAFVLGVFAVLRYRRKSMLVVVGTSIGFAVLAWVVSGLVRSIV